MFTKSTSSLKYVNYQHWRTKLCTDGTSISSYTKWRLPQLQQLIKMWGQTAHFPRKNTSQLSIFSTSIESGGNVNDLFSGSNSTKENM